MSGAGVASLSPMRVIRALLAAVAPAAVFVVLMAAPAGAQTTTTSSVPSLPVTGTGPTTTTTAPSTDDGDTASASATAPDLATTGIDADILFKLGVALVLLGAVVQLGERSTRAPEPKLTLG